MQSALLTERARCSQLELQLRALAAEVLRGQHAGMEVGRAVLPSLSNIEHKLTGMAALQRALFLENGGGASADQRQTMIVN